MVMDEANSTGVIGKNDAGCVEYLGYTGRELIQMGTLSKALGSLGGYITGSRTLIDFLRNRSCTQLDLYHSPFTSCLLYTSPSPRDGLLSRMPSSA